MPDTSSIVSPPASGIKATAGNNGHSAGKQLPKVWEGEPPPDDPIEVALLAGTVEAAYELVPVLITMTAGERGLVIAKLKERLGKALNQNDFRAAITEAQRSQVAPEVAVVAPKRPAAPPATFEQVVSAMRRGLYIPNPDDMAVALATVQANRAPGDPVWLLMVGPPSRGKTERLQPLAALQWVHPIATLTEAALLSATPARDRARSATGGVLRQIGEFGIIFAKDFTSLLATPRDTLGPVLAAHREIYDGSWCRSVGTDGGLTLTWQGKCGYVAGVTDAIDSAHAVMSSLGERFILYRLSLDGEDEQCLAALEASGAETHWRAETAEAVRGLLENLPAPAGPAALSEQERRALIALARLAVRCRSGVERDPRTRELLNVPGHEGPTRLVKVLSLLLAGLDSIGIQRPDGWRIIRKVALDSMPARRRRVFDYLCGETTGQKTTGMIAAEVGMPTATVRISLEDLQAHGVTVADKQSDESNAAWLWTLSDLARELWQVSLHAIQDTMHTPYTSCDDSVQGQSWEGGIPYKQGHEDDLGAYCSEMEVAA